MSVDTDVTAAPHHTMVLGDEDLIATDKKTQLHASCVMDRATLIAIDECTWPRSGNVVIKPEISVDAPVVLRPHPITQTITQPPFEGRARYELGAMIGRGGMGEVFVAYDAQLGREVAIKRLHANKITPSSLARFLREARIQGWLDHPSIPSVYELGSDDEGRPFFVMKRLSGITLDEILAARDLPPRFTEQQLLRAFVEICLTVEFAHTRRVVHRDLKPANMLLGEFGEVYVLDWGVARAVNEPRPSGEPAQHTIDEAGRTAGVLGTPGYMAPEQVCGEHVDGRADVYALGCVLFEILAGRRLHPSGLAGMTSALAGVTASPSVYRDHLAPELDALCRRSTATDRNERIASARELGEAVQRYLDGDRDLVMRRELARHHLDLARQARGIEISAMDSVAMREAGRALAFDPTLPGAAELVSRLMLQPGVSTPTAVLAELEEAAIPEQRRMAKVSIGIYTAYACAVPILLVLGIRDAPYLSALLAIALGNIAIASLPLLHRRAAPRLLAAIGHAAMFALIARMFTPLFLAPGVVALTLMAYALHPSTGRRDLLSAGALAAVAVLGVWSAEAFGWISSTTVVDGGVVRLMPPLDGAAQFPIVPALCCYSVLLVAVATKLAYSAVRRGRDARRELHIQAWRLRQLVSLDAPPARSL